MYNYPDMVCIPSSNYSTPCSPRPSLDFTSLINTSFPFNFTVFHFTSLPFGFTETCRLRLETIKVIYFL